MSKQPSKDKNLIEILIYSIKLTRVNLAHALKTTIKDLNIVKFFNI